ncbi:MAG: hypothetical protein GYA18_02845 [Chloroflexi bacterium]|nr:hypothetical protein [Chloroflexota bacterium]
MTIKKNFYLFIITILSGIFVSCQSINQATITDGIDNQQVSVERHEPRKLTICMGYPPQSLYIYKASSQVEWSILQTIYDGPFDVVEGSFVPVILENVPTFENGDMQVSSITIKPGDKLLDSNGNPTTLETGITYLPIGCTSSDCAVTWDGKSPVELDQTTISFHLIRDISWSDGKPLTANDSVFSFLIASNSTTPNAKTIVNQISSYSGEGSTITASLLPGLIPSNSPTYFFSPLPKHVWENLSESEILDAALTNQFPLGWGPYMVKEWQDNSIILEKNPNYFRASDGLPYFDELEFRFISNQGDTNLASLDFDYAPFEILEYNWSPDGETIYLDQCDFIDASVDFSDQYDMFDYLLHYYMTPAIQVFMKPNYMLNGIWLNPQKQINHALQPVLSMCIDREFLNSKVNYSIAFPTYNVTSPYEKSDNSEYSTETARRMLEEMGWIDEDQNPETPRTAHEIDAIPNGTTLILNMDILNDDFTIKEAQIVQQSLQDCGVQMNIHLFEASEYYSESGPINSMEFDLMFFTHQISSDFPCDVLDSPWNPIVFPGLDQLSYVRQDCEITTQSSDHFRDLPLIPLYYQSDISLARNDLCGFSASSGTMNDLWNLEEFNYGEECMN